MNVSTLVEHRCRLGEGPLWDRRCASLYWVDSLAPALFRYCPKSSRFDEWKLPGESIGSLAVRDCGGLVLAIDQGFYLFDPDNPGQPECIAMPLAGRDGIRFNDGKVDPFGGFVCGAMNIDPQGREDCPLFLLTPQFEVIELLDGFQCFNGPCFSPGGDRLYLTGRSEGVIEVFDYGPAQRPGKGRVLLSGCNPDGATVDRDGFVWSAQWDDGCLLRISPDGKIEARLDANGEIATSVMFGGDSLERLFVTTLGCEYYGAVPGGDLRGQVLVFDASGYRGLPEPGFRG